MDNILLYVMLTSIFYVIDEVRLVLLREKAERESDDPKYFDFDRDRPWIQIPRCVHENLVLVLRNGNRGAGNVECIDSLVASFDKFETYSNHYP